MVALWMDVDVLDVLKSGIRQLEAMEIRRLWRQMIKTV